MTSLIHDPKLSALRARIPALAGAIRITPLGGLTNLNYRVDTPEGTYVMRVSQAVTALLCINRENERVNTERAYRAGVGAALVDSLPAENVLVIRWIEAETLHEANLQSQPGLLPRIATSLKTLHSGSPFQGVFHFPTVRRAYLRTVVDAGYFLPDRYLEIEPLVQRLEEVLALTPEELVPCNNDLLAENFMDDGEKIWIIDFEYSGQNEASFEIGNLASESFLSDETLTQLCDAYWQRHIPAKINRAMAWSMIARFGWVLWASIQEAISPIDFDFRSWGRIKWNSVVPELQGNRYQQVFENLTKITS
jgi:thiamine kinase-like enzyme